MQNAVRTIGRAARSALPIAVVGLLAFVILWKLQYSTRELIDPDIYYHLKYASITLDNGIIHDFPWCQFSLFKDHFADKDFLYHVLLLPFVRYDLMQAGKLFPVCFGTLIVVVVFLILRFHKVVHPWLWLTVFLLWPPVFLYRLTMPRPHLVAILMLVLMTHALIGRQRLLLFMVSCLFPLAHSMAILIWAIPLLYEINRWRVDGRFEWSTIRITLLGLGAGFLLHPNFPNNLRVFFVQAITIPKMLWLGGDIGFGAEFLPFNPREFLLDGFVALGLSALAIWLTLTRRYDLDPKIGFLLVLNVMVFTLAVLSKRFLEFFVPLNVIFLGLVFSRLVPNAGLKAMSAKFGIRRLAGQVLLVAVALGLCAYHNYTRTAWALRRNKQPDYSGAAKWLLGNTNAGDIVFTTDWDEMPYLFLYNSKNYYLNALDPAYMYCWNPMVFREWRQITTGFRSNVYRDILEDFRSKHVFVAPDFRFFYQMLMHDPRFELVHKDNWCALFRLRHGPFDYFLASWSFSGPYTREEERTLVAAAGGEDAILRPRHSEAPTTFTVAFQPCKSGTMQYGFVDLLEQFSTATTPLTKVCAYAHTAFSCPTSGPALLHLGFGSSATVWLNEKVVFRSSRADVANPDGHVMRLDLTRGANAIDIKTWRHAPDWGFYCWISDGDSSKVLVSTAKGGVWRNREEE